MNISRRVFLSGSASLIVTAPMISNAFGSSLTKKNLVVVMLRGGMDGLTAVPFIGNNILADARPDIGVEKPLKLTSDFALHPQLKSFKKLWDKDKASIFHATSIPYTGRSHFEGQYLMESGGTLPYYDKTGWLGRALETGNRKSLSISLPMPLILRGGRDLDNFMPSSNKLPSDETLKILADDYSKDKVLSNVLNTIRQRPIAMMQNSKNASQDVKKLAKIAGEQLAQSDGPNIAVFDVAGFDTLLSLLPQDLARSSSDIYQLSYTEAFQYIDGIKRSGASGIEIPQVQLYARMAYPFSIVVVLVIGFAVAAVRRKGGKGVYIAAGLVISFLYLVIMKIMEPFGALGLLPPIWAALIPHLLFLCVGLIGIKLIRK